MSLLHEAIIVEKYGLRLSVMANTNELIRNSMDVAKAMIMLHVDSLDSSQADQVVSGVIKAMENNSKNMLKEALVELKRVAMIIIFKKSNPDKARKIAHKAMLLLSQSETLLELATKTEVANDILSSILDSPPTTPAPPLHVSAPRRVFCLCGPTYDNLSGKP